MNRDEFMELVYETFADEPDNVLANGIIEAADAYVEHEKAQLSKEGTTSDLISRTETVERLRGVIDVTVPITDYDGGYVDGVEVGISMVSTMPSIQSQSTAGQPNDGVRSTARSTDLIDRQQALDAVGKYASVWMEYTDAMSKDEIAQIALNNAKSTMIRILKELPTAQPEPQEGHWIDKGWNGDWAWQIDGRGNCWRVIECSECGKGVSVESNYCPHCGAHMKGAEHEID